MSTPATPPAGAATRGRGRKPRASPSGAASTSSPAAGPSQPTTPPTATSRRGRGKGGRGGKETTPTAAGDTSSSAAAAVVVVVAEQRRSEVPRERLKICVHGFPAKITAAQVLAQLPARHVEHISYCFVPAAKTVLLGFDSAAALQELCRDVQHNAVPGLPSLRVSYAPFQRLPRGVFLGLPDGEAATAGDEQEAEIYSHAGYLDFVRQLNTPPEAAPFQISGVRPKTEPVITPLLEDLRRKRLAKLAQKKRKQQRSAAAKRAAAAAATPSATDDATPVDATAAPAKRRRNRPRGRNKARDAASAAAQPPDATPRPTPATPSDSSTPKQRDARRTAKPAAAAASNNNLRPPSADATPASAGEAKAPGTKFRRGRRGAAAPS